MKYLSVSEAAEALNVSVPTVKRYLYEGQLKSTKLPGGQHRIPETEVQRLLDPSGEAQQTESAASAALEQRLEVLESWNTELQAEVERLQAGLEVLSRYCERHLELEGHEETAVTSGHRVLILGPGCKRCDALYDVTTKALAGLEVEGVEVERVKHLDDITAYGPILTPALIVDGRLVLSGRVPSESTLRRTLEQQLARS